MSAPVTAGTSADEATGAATGAALSPCTVTVCRDGAEFGALAEEWQRLCRASPTATPFQHHAWLYSWWRSYGTAGRLRLVLVRHEGRLVGAAPLHRTGSMVLAPLGGGITDFCDVLLDEECAGAAEALAAGLARLAGSAVVDFREVRPGAALERVREVWRGPSRVLPDSVCLELPAVPMERLVERLPSSRAQRTRAKLRKLDAAGVVHRDVGAAEVPQALDRLLELHRRQWQGRGVTAEHLSARFADHLRRAVAPMVAGGDARVTEFSLDGRVVAADLTLVSPRLSGGYLYGADPVLRSMKLDVATMLLRHGAREAGAGGSATLSMLRGTEPYKDHWCPETVGNRRILLAGRRTAPLLALLVARARGRAWAADTARDWAWVRGLRGGGRTG
ncbi:GNAT family N-acetyltransferase [Streptomyces sp. NPDC050504]|uniref:GNAT family N-acetyltransferase n=1 Tax=Streptomyces sp. NPDC050504 TaxID=3365618 RepID=UPI0037B86ACE